MRYDLKVIQELAWAVLVTFLTFVLTAFVTDVDVADWRQWAVSVGIGGARAAAGALIAALAKGRVEPS